MLFIAMIISLRNFGEMPLITDSFLLYGKVFNYEKNASKNFFQGPIPPKKLLDFNILSLNFFSALNTERADIAEFALIFEIFYNSL